MQNRDQDLKQLALTEEERVSLPLGYSQIYTRQISHKRAELAATVYSRKYRKSDLLPLCSEKPVSKLVASPPRKLM